MGARISGGGTRRPPKPGRRGEGVPAPPGLVAHWCSPLTSSSSEYFSKIPEKIILDFQDIRRTFIFGVLFYGTLKAENRKN